MYIPASLLVLKRKVANEQTTCWILIALTALSGSMASILIGEFTLGVYSLAIVGFASDGTELFANDAGSTALSMFPLLNGVFNMIMSLVLGLVAPAGIVVLAVFDYNRTYRLTVSDLVWKDMALFFIQDEYALLIEQARVQRFRINPNPVDLGDTLAQRLQHFAAYYTQYRRMAKPVGDVKIPTVMERNCWADGLLLSLGACLSPCCLGIVLIIPMIARIVGAWPKQVAIKQAVVHYFEGRFDQTLEEQWQNRLS